MLHAIFQRHHIPPDEVYAKDMRYRRFMYASMELVFDDEEKQRKEQAKQVTRGAGGRRRVR